MKFETLGLKAKKLFKARWGISYQVEKIIWVFGCRIKVTKSKSTKKKEKSKDWDLGKFQF